MNYFFNSAKLLLLGGFSCLILCGVGFAVADEEGILLALITWLAIVAGFYGLSDKIVLKMCRAEMLTVYHSPALFKTVEDVCNQTGFPMPKIYMISEDGPNAGSVGFSTKRAGLLFTDGVTKFLTSDELRSAIAHQFVQVRRMDTAVGMVAGVIGMLLGMNSKIARERASAHDSGSRRQAFVRFGFRGALILFAPVASYVVRMLINMKRVFKLDVSASATTGKPLDMANTIRTMEKKKYLFPTQIPPAVGHLFVVSPIRSVPVMTLFKSHPPMEERTQRLEALQRSVYGLSGKQKSA